MKTKTFLHNCSLIRIILIVIIGAIGALSLFCDYREQNKIRVNRLRDELSFVDLVKLESGDYAVERGQLEKYLKYFQSVSENDPSRADAYAMTGFCYYHLGDVDQAVAAYQKAVMLNPKALLFRYNLAAIAFLQGHYQQAFAGFEAALKTSRADNLDFFRNSKIFVYIVYKAKLLTPSLGERLKRNYELSAYYMIESLKKGGEPKRAEVLEQQMSAAGMGIPKDQGDPLLKVF